MSYDEKLKARIEKQVGGARGVTSKKMFGGVAWMKGGNMFAGIVKNDLMVRVGPGRHDEFVREPNARVMDFTGRPMRGYVFVSPAGCAKDADLKRWIGRGMEFAATLPAKKAGKAKKVKE
ncbi:MAG: hypothetical protein FD180_3340 [Planctomycetota bacterium]|nr:MAG: hypothetical protein FD180_3340 [Planctomycetota bacterium]